MDTLELDKTSKKMKKSTRGGKQSEVFHMNMEVYLMASHKELQLFLKQS